MKARLWPGRRLLEVGRAPGRLENSARTTGLEGEASGKLLMPLLTLTSMLVKSTVPSTIANGEMRSVSSPSAKTHCPVPVRPPMFAAGLAAVLPFPRRTPPFNSTGTPDAFALAVRRSSPVTSILPKPETVEPCANPTRLLPDTKRSPVVVWLTTEPSLMIILSPFASNSRSPAALKFPLNRRRSEPSFVTLPSSRLLPGPVASILHLAGEALTSRALMDCPPTTSITVVGGGAEPPVSCAVSREPGTPVSQFAASVKLEPSPRPVQVVVS